MAKKELKYPWKYLKETLYRGKKIYGLIEKYIRDYNSFLDCFCGFSPLVLRVAEEDYWGFDNNIECIKFLKEEYPKGKWILSEDKDFNLEGEKEVLFYLGITDGHHEADSKNEAKTVNRLIGQLKPKAVVLEMSQRIGWDNWIRVVNYLEIWGYSRVSPLMAYDAKLSVNSTRVVVVYKKK